MTLITYVPKRFTAEHLAVVGQAVAIIDEYHRQGFRLTLRQLYYQFVARDFIPNNLKSYKRLGKIIVDARLAGMVSWTAIEDRTRSLRGVSHWDDPKDIIEASASGYSLDKWFEQDTRVEVWMEKDAVAGIVGSVCNDLDIDYFSCRGYPSQSEMWAAAQRMKRYERGEQNTVILHLGDHDPSGIDMTRDITDKMALFGAEVDVQRIALNMDQINQYNPPPNYAKVTDSRFEGYVAEYGEECWELDALEPQVLDELIRKHVREYRDDVRFRSIMKQQEEDISLLNQVAEKWDEVVSWLQDQE